MGRDYSTWLTKQQAAEAIGVSTKSIEKFAQDGMLQQRQWYRPEGGPAIAVYHPRDVERLRKERNPDSEPFVVPEEKVPEETAITVRRPLPEQLFQALQALTSQRSQPSVPLYRKRFLTLPEAAEYTGLGIGYLQKWVRDGTLTPLKGAGPHGALVLRRSQLEKI